MQPLFSRTSRPAGSTVGWLAAGVPGRAGVSPLTDASADAGVGLLRRDPADGDTPRLDMRLGDDLQALLQIRPEATDAPAAGDHAYAEVEADAGPDAVAVPHRSLRAVQSTVDALRQAYGVDPDGAAGQVSRAESLVGQYAALWHWGPIARSPDRDAMMAGRATAMLDALARRGEPAALIEQVRTGIDAMRKASGLLERRVARIHRRLDRPDAALRSRLDTASVDSDAVRLGLHRTVNRLLCDAVRWAARGQAVFPLLPGSEALLEMAVAAAAGGPAAHAGPVATSAAGAQVATKTPAATMSPGGTAAAATAATAVPPAIVVAPAASADATTASALPAETRAALALLADFKARWRTQLWQFTGTADEAAQLSMGQVDFRDMATLASTFPCAVGMRQVPDRTPPSLYGPTHLRTLHAPVYPAGTTLFSTVRKATLNGHEVVVRRDDATGRVSVRTGGRPPQLTEFHTDATVEAAKLAMWTRIFQEAFARSLPQ